ncbi:DUF4230 domain-containing protein [Sphingomonas sp. ID0503]|uniref:DUF4230 domain-containing protein n=1 Tax=Sphingomonas sp. ID0503 TaxID=3399691 RepID=UPI003AFA1D5A
MADRGLKRIVIIALALFVGLALVALAVREASDRWWSGPEPQAIVDASLQGIREQNRLSALVADYVAVVTARQSRFGLTAQKTLIMPGTVRYEVDLAKLAPGDLRWDGTAKELRVVLPPIEVVGPQVDLTRIREYDAGGLLMRFSDTGQRLDMANRKAGQAELLRQAKQPAPMRMAKDATRRAIERSFALPLQAAGVEATVRVRFPDEPDFPARNDEQMDRSRSLNEVMSE